MVQLLLAAAIYISGSREEQHTKKPFISIKKDTINKIKIASQTDEAELIKKGGRWRLAKLEQLPVNVEKVNTAIDQLMSLKTNWPVTTTTSSHERFELSEKKFQRMITLVKDEKAMDTLILGTSPSFKKAHVRKLDDNNVYSLALNSYDFPVNSDDWLDKGLLAVTEQTKIKGKDFTLIKIDDKWSLEGNNIIDSKLEEDKASLLSEALASLKVTGLAKNEIDFSSKDVIIIEVSSTENRQLRFLEKENSYYVKRDDFSQAFTLGKTDFERIAKISTSDLLVNVEDDTNINQKSTSIETDNPIKN